MHASGLFVEHPNGRYADHATITHKCPLCSVSWEGPTKTVLHAYQEHIYDKHLYDPKLGGTFVECGSCGCYHFKAFTGDCREDWERF